MAEVGLVRFARVARQVAAAVLPAYRTPFSKHVFTQPQLLAIPCLMRDEDWTFREAEVCLAEHAAWRRALRVEKVPDHMTVYRFLRRLTPFLLTSVLQAVLRRLLFTRPANKTTVAIDATGLIPDTISTFWIQRRAQHGGTWWHWLKWIIVVDVPQRVLLAQTARRALSNDCARLRPPWWLQLHRWSRSGSCVRMVNLTVNGTTNTSDAL